MPSFSSPDTPGIDETTAGDYKADPGDPGVQADLPPATAGSPGGH
ncbi:hypothetical protein ACFWMG_30900 [Streptomyces sp. NPDC127074]